MEIKGCGKTNVGLTFYVVPTEPKPRHRLEGIACGLRAETKLGRGVLLCAECADRHGLKVRWRGTEPEVQGCGRTNTTLTLYHVAGSGQARPLCYGFEHLRCGIRPSTFEYNTYGVLLCKECAGRFAFPEYSKPSRR